MGNLYPLALPSELILVHVFPSSENKCRFRLDLFNRASTSEIVLHQKHVCIFFKISIIQICQGQLIDTHDVQTFSFNLSTVINLLLLYFTSAISCIVLGCVFKMV